MASNAASLRFAVGVSRRGSAGAALAVSVPCAGGRRGLPVRPSVTQAPPRTERRRQLANRLLLAGAGGCIGIAAIPLTILPARGPGELVVEFLDIGQGDAILVTTPHGRQVLVDGGPSGVRLARELGEVLPHWDRSLDVVVLTHPQEDHMGGLPEIASRMTVATVYTSGHTNGTLTFAAFEDRFATREVLAAGGRFTIDEVVFEALWRPSGFDRGSSTCLGRAPVSYGPWHFSWRETSKAARAARNDVVSRCGAAILKVPHHGSKTSAPEFLSAVRPAVAVVQVGADNRFGHPHAQALEALASSRVYRTDQRGRVTVSTDGRSITVATER